MEATVLEKMNGRHTLYSTEEGALEAVLNKQVDGNPYDEITLRYYSDHDYKENILIYPTTLKRFALAYGLPKNSAWRSRIHSALLDLMERPDWAFILSRYGMGQNFERLPSPPLYQTQAGPAVKVFDNFRNLSPSGEEPGAGTKEPFVLPAPRFFCPHRAAQSPKAFRQTLAGVFLPWSSVKFYSRTSRPPPPI